MDQSEFVKQDDRSRHASVWPASIDCDFQRTAAGKTALVRLSHQGPLRIQKLFHDGDLAHCYVLHPPGGMVSGDSLQSRFKVNPGAKVLITTPASGKLYKARRNQIPQRASTHIDLTTDTFCAHLPQDTIVFDGAVGELETFVNVNSNAIFFGWEHLIFGRRAGGYPFENGQLIQSLRISREKRLLFRESLRLTPQTVNAVSGLNDMVSFASVTLVLPANSGTTSDVVSVARESLKSFDVHSGVSAIRECLITLRILSSVEEETKSALEQLWITIGPELVDRPVSSPRIWRT
jgi:urease accessory protein